MFNYMSQNIKNEVGLEMDGEDEDLEETWRRTWIKFEVLSLCWD